MGRAEIIATALQVGVKEYGPNTRNWSFELAELESFVALVAEKAAAREREECCAPDVTNSAGICAADMPHVVVQKYCAAIRARAQKGGV